MATSAYKTKVWDLGCNSLGRVLDHVVLATEDELPIYNMTGIQGEFALKSEILGSWRDGAELRALGTLQMTGVNSQFPRGGFHSP